MKQQSFASLAYASKKRKTRREKFLGEMERVVPWSRLIALIEPKYPSSGRVGRPPIGVARMLRMYFLQQWYSLNDEALEDAICDSQAMRDFVGIDLSREQVPDATTLLKFRRLLEDWKLTKAIFDEVNAHLGERGPLMREGTLVDTTIIAAPSSIAANESDIAHTHEVLHGEEILVYADAGYTGIEKREEIAAAQAAGKIRRDVAWHIATKRGKIVQMAEGRRPSQATAGSSERKKAQISSLVEHPFHVIKNLFGHKKVSYKGLAKNRARMFSLFALGT